MTMRLIAAVLIWILAAATASAHTHLKNAEPANGSVLAQAPERITLQFTEAVRVTALSIQKGSQPAQKLGPLPQQPAATISVPMNGQGAGEYLLVYRVLSADGHVMSGEVRFKVGG